MATNTEFEFRGINHLALVSSDMARTVDFYTNVLGMPLIKTLETSSSFKARAAAAEALGRLGDTRAIGPLQTAADGSKSELVRQAARDAQKRLFHVSEEEDQQ